MITHYCTSEVEHYGRLMEIETEFSYAVDQPLAVQMKFLDPSGEVIEWTVAREVMTEGTKGPAGAGDVQMWPTDSGKTQMAISLASDQGDAVILVKMSEVRTFLMLAAELLPVGAEEEILNDQLDSWLEELMEKGA